MKLTKENIYIVLIGKSKEELTELYNFLTSVGERPFRDEEWFLNYSNDDEKVGFSGVHFCGLGINFKDKNEVTIQQLKEILKPKKMTRNQELIEEAKKRGYTHNNFKCLNKSYNRTSIESLDKWYYNELEDTLFTNTRMNGGKAVYKNGVWAELVKPVEEYKLDLSMCRILVDNAEQSKKLQELAFELSYSWSLMSKTVTNTHARVLYFNSEDYRITFSDLDLDDSEFKTFHFTDIFKETLQEKEQRLLKELEEVRKEIEENEIKVNDWVCIDSSKCFFKVRENDFNYLDNRHRRITNQELIKLLEQEIK